MKKIIIFITILFVSQTVYASQGFIYNPDDSLVPNRVIWGSLSTSTIKAPATPAGCVKVFNPTIAEGLVNYTTNTFIVSYMWWKWDGSGFIEMSQADKDAIAANSLANSIASTHTSAKANLTRFEGMSLTVRAVIQIYFNEFNRRREFDQDIKVSVAAMKAAILDGSTLGEIKTAVNAIAIPDDVPQATLQQFITLIENNIDATEP